MPPRLNRLFLLFSLPLLTFALYTSLRLSYADYLARLGTPAALDRAIKLVPDNAAYLLRRASRDQSRAEADLKKAAALDTTSAAPWIELGLRAEAAGNSAEAERYLLTAAERDATYLPRWTLANFYFRCRRWDEFWKWAASAASIGDMDMQALYQLCLQAGGQPREVLDRIVPPRADARRQFLHLLIADGRLEETLPVAEALLNDRRPTDTEFLQRLCGRLAEESRPTDAIALWNRLAAVGVIPFEALDPAAGRSLTNGAWKQPLATGAFNWFPRRVDGVEVRPLGPAGGLTIRFNGRQPDRAFLLLQKLPLVPRARYRLDYLYNREGRETEAACRWRIAGQVSNPLDSSTVATGSFEFTAPAEPIAILELVLIRTPGTTLPEGSLDLQKTTLDLLSR